MKLKTIDLESVYSETKTNLDLTYESNFFCVCCKRYLVRRISFDIRYIKTISKVLQWDNGINIFGAITGYNRIKQRKNLSKSDYFLLTIKLIPLQNGRKKTTYPPCYKLPSHPQKPFELNYKNNHAYE